MPRRPVRCSILSGQVAKMLDAQRHQGAEYQPDQRIGKPTDGGFWKTRDGLLVSEFGPKVTPLPTRERLSLIGKVNSFGEGGNWIAEHIELFQNQVDIHHASDIQGMQGVLSRLKPNEWSNLWQVVEQRSHDTNANGIYLNDPGSSNVSAVNQNVAQAAAFVTDYFKNRRELAEKIGVTGFKGRNFYAPEFYETKTIQAAGYRQRAVDGLAEKISKRKGHITVQPDDIASANLVFDEYVGPQYARVAANLQKLRFLDSAEGRILDPNQVISMYSSQFWKAYYEKSVFGAREGLSEFPLKLLDAIGRVEKDAADGTITGGLLSRNAQAIKNQTMALVRDTLGVYPADPTLNDQWIRTLGSLQTLKLSLSVLKNSTQSMNTWYRTNLPSLGKAISAMISNSEVTMGLKARDFAGMMGTVLQDAVYEATLYQDTGVLGRLGSGVLKYSGFTGMEKMNRAVAGLSGAFYAQQQASQFLATGKKRFATAIRELGILPEEVIAQNGKLTPEQMLLAGQKIINATQFRARMSDLPYFATNNQSLWRALLMFRTFQLNQSKLLIDGVRRNPVRLGLFGLVGMPAVGAMVGFANEMIREDVLGAPPKKGNTDPVIRYLEAHTAAGGYGVISDMFLHAYRTGTGQGMGYKFFEPPIAASLDDYLTASGQLMTGNIRGFAKTLGRQFGGLGSAFVNGVLNEED